jgi:transcriptional regulator CtsR
VIILGTLADEIERYIKKILEASHDGIVELQRNELALQFSCVPSQINYVLSTRFTTEQGYIVESRRGGGGYVRIVKAYVADDSELSHLIRQLKGKKVNQYAAEGLIERLVEEDFLTKREGLLIKAIINNEVLDNQKKDHNIFRGNILSAILFTLLKEEFGA